MDSADTRFMEGLNRLSDLINLLKSVTINYIIPASKDKHYMKRLILGLLILALGVPQALAQPMPISAGFEPSFSHDGGLIAYASMDAGHRDIFVTSEAGAKKRLVDDIYMDGQPVFSPGDDAVVFVSDRSGDRELWQIDLDAKNLRQLTPDGSWKSSPSVSPFGTIAFTAGRHPHLDIYILENGAIRRLTNLNDEIYSPTWSPDGQRLAFVKGEELMIIEAEGSGLRRITSGVYFRGLSWSHDNKIFYLSRALGYDLWSIDLEKEVKELIYEGVTDSWEVNPAVSSDGRVAFSTDKDGFYTLYVIDTGLPDVYVESTPDTSSVAVAPEPVVAQVENPVEIVNPSIELAEEESRNSVEKAYEDEIELPQASDQREDEIEIPKQPPFDEITIPDPSMPVEGEGRVSEDHLSLWMLAAASLFVLLTERLKRKDAQILAL